MLTSHCTHPYTFAHQCSHTKFEASNPSNSHFTQYSSQFHVAVHPNGSNYLLFFVVFFSALHIGQEQVHVSPIAQAEMSCCCCLSLEYLELEAVLWLGSAMSIPQFEKSVQAAVSWSICWFVTKICPRGWFWFEQHQGSLTALMCLDSVVEEQSLLGAPKSWMREW